MEPAQSCAANSVANRGGDFSNDFWPPQPRCNATQGAEEQTAGGRGKAQRSPERVGRLGEIRFAEGLSQRVALTTVRITRSYAIRVFGQLSVCAAPEAVSALWRRTSRRQGDIDNRPAKLMGWQSLLRTTIGATRYASGTPRTPPPRFPAEPRNDKEQGAFAPSP
jgi:hypothetical protein